MVKTVEETGQLIDMSAENLQELKRCAEKVEIEVIFRYIRILSSLANDMKYGNNKRVMLEVAMIRLCRPQMEQDYDSLIQRMHNLEQLNDELQTALSSGSLMVSADASGGSDRGQPGVEPAVSSRQIRPEAVPDDVRDVVANWKQILSRVSQVCRSMLLDVRLSVSEAGKLVLAFPQSTTAEYFKKEENQRELVEAAGQLTGKEISIQVSYVENRQEMNALPELRNIIKNVEIEMIE